MLSAQVDELREFATRYDELQVGAVKAVTMPSNMGSILRNAADTIWELRDDLQRANADNAKLRELCAGLLTGYECGYGELCKGCTWDGIGDSKTFSCLPRAKARELGVEVSE